MPAARISRKIWSARAWAVVSTVGYRVALLTMSERELSRPRPTSGRNTGASDRWHYQWSCIPWRNTLQHQKNTVDRSDYATTGGIVNTTATITSASGKIQEMRPVEPEFWEHGGPIEVGQYFREHDEFLADRMNRGEIIYHYTDLVGLSGIVREGAIWASDVRLMNDRAEVTYALEQMRSLIASDEENSIGDETLDAIFHPGRIWQFAACFSLARDQLSQWRAYGAKVGVAIGFSRNHLTRAVEAQNGRIVNCRYFGPRHFSGITQELDEIISGLTAPGALNSDGKLTDMGLQGRLTRHAVDVATSIKHESFVEEREVRLIVPVSESSERLEFRSSSESLNPFVKIDVDNRRLKTTKKERFTNHLGMMEVLVWPNDADDQTLDAIDMLMSRAGNVLIKRSASPYRT